MVQKFGGSSVATAQHIAEVAQKIQRVIEQGHQVVVVASAMGDSTDHLVDLASELTSMPAG
ncbi:MAG: amino acid kinase family protein, partial [Sulfobacillus sp.]